MFKSAKTGWVGFDIGATSVKAAQVVRTDAGPRIRSAAIVPRTERWAALSDNQPQSSADEILSSASLCDRLTGADASTLLPIAACDIVQMDAPTAKRGGAPPDLLRAIEVETHRPLRDHVADSWPIAMQAGKINAIVAPRPWSDQISADVAAGGWNCRLVDALPWALARAANLAGSSEPGKPIAALDWAYGRATFCLVHRGAPALVRSLKDCAFQSVLETIAQGLRLDERDAEMLLQRYGLDAAHNGERGSAGVIEDLLDKPLNRLTSELRRTLDYWRGVTRGQLPEVIYIFGGGGTLAGIGRRLTDQLGLRVEPWQLPAENQAHAALLPPACLLGAAIGLSAAAWEAP
jgi:Tfp pilus assembly PilM family ATPase